MKKNSFKMIVPKNNDFLMVVRFSVMSICEKLGFSFEDIEDIKIAFTEAAKIFLIGSKKEHFEIEIISSKDGIEALIVESDLAKEDLTPAEIKEIKIGVYVIESLMGESEIIINDDGCKTIKLSKYIS